MKPVKRLRIIPGYTILIILAFLAGRQHRPLSGQPNSDITVEAKTNHPGNSGTAEKSGAPSGMHPALARLALANAAQVLQETMNLPPGPERAERLEQALCSLALTEPLTVLAFLRQPPQRLEEDIHRCRFTVVRTAFSTLGCGPLEDGIAAFRKLRDSDEQSKALHILAESPAASQMPGWLHFLETLPKSQIGGEFYAKANLLSEALKKASAPDVAEWLRRNAPWFQDLDRDMRIIALSRLIPSDPAGIIEFYGQMAPANEVDDLIPALTEETKIQEFLKTLPPELIREDYEQRVEREFYSPVTGRILEFRFRQDPGGLIAFAQATENPDLQHLAAFTMAGLANEEYNSTNGERISILPAGELRRSLLEPFLTEWLNLRPEEALRWTDQLEDSERDALLVYVANHPPFWMDEEKTRPLLERMSPEMLREHEHSIAPKTPEDYDQAVSQGAAREKLQSIIDGIFQDLRLKTEAVNLSWLEQQFPEDSPFCQAALLEMSGWHSVPEEEAREILRRIRDPVDREQARQRRAAVEAGVQ